MRSTDTLLSGLAEILEKEKDIYSRMILVSEDMKVKIISDEVNELSDMIEKLTDLADKAAELENERISVSVQLGGELGIKNEQPSLLEICKNLEDPGQREELSKFRANLKELLDRLTALNANNQALLDRKKKYTGVMLKSMLKSEQAGCFYDNTGSASAYPVSCGLIDRQI